MLDNAPLHQALVVAIAELPVDVRTALLLRFQLVLGIVGGASTAIATLFAVRVLRRWAARTALGRAPASDAAPV